MNNRERAYVIFFMLFLVRVLVFKKTRKWIYEVIEIAISWKLWMMLFFYFLWFSSIVFLLWYIWLWDTSKVQMTIFWFVSIGLYSLYSSMQKSIWYFKKTILKVFSWSFIFTFVINLFSFPLLQEIILGIIMIFLSILQWTAGFFSEKDKKYIATSAFLKNIIFIISFIIVLYSLYTIFLNIRFFLNQENITNYALTIIFTIWIAVFLYVINLYINYESLFCRIKQTNKNIKPKVLKKVYRSIIKYLHLNLSKLTYLSKNSRLWEIDSVDYLQKKLKEIEKKEINTN